jgi:hypothetical protein
MHKLSKIFKTYIKGTPEKSVVSDLTLHICQLTRVVAKSGNFKSHKVYITTKVLKHLYDKKPAEEFDAIMKDLHSLISYPESLYENKSGKRGEICFVKTFKDGKYICCIEQTEANDPLDGQLGMNCVVTAFRIRKDNYLKNYKLLWSWKVDIPSS